MSRHATVISLAWQMVAWLANARADARSGQLEVPPGAWVDSAPTAQPSAAASGIDSLPAALLAARH